MVNSKKKAISSIAVGLVAVSLIGFGGSTALGGFGTSTINASTATGVTAQFSQMKMTSLAAGGLATGGVSKSTANGTVSTQLSTVLSTLEPGAVGTETFLRVINDSTTADQTFQTSYEFVVKNAAGVDVTDSVAVAAVLDSITIDMSAFTNMNVALDGFSLTASALNGTSKIVGTGGVADQVAPGSNFGASFDSVVSETLDSAYAGYSVTMTVTVAGETV